MASYSIHMPSGQMPQVFSGSYWHAVLGNTAFFLLLKVGNIMCMVTGQHSGCMLDILCGKFVWSTCLWLYMIKVLGFSVFLSDVVDSAYVNGVLFCNLGDRNTLPL
jgi:hypothetical protein